MKAKFFTHLLSIAVLGGLVSPLHSYAQNEYFREGFEAGHTFPTSDQPAQYVTGSSSGTWYVNGVFVTNGSATNNCSGTVTTIGPSHARLRSAVPLPDTAYIVTPVLDFGIQNLNFINGRTGRNFTIYKTTDTLATTTNWTVVSVLTSPAICQLFTTVVVNDATAKRLKIQSRGDSDVDSVWITSTSTIMPVIFTEIAASITNGRSKITWNIQAEMNTAKYLVERSADGLNFTLAGEVAANNAGKYTWFDNTASLGNKVFYRVKAVDKDGKFMYSRIIFVSQKGGNASFNVLPNPVVNHLANIQLSNFERGAYRLSIINQAGQSVFVKSIENTSSNSIQSLSLPASVAPGMYTIRIANETSTYSKHIIIN